MPADLTQSDGMVRAWASGAQTWIGNGLHKVQCDQIDWDPDFCYNTTTNHYTAPTDGYYLLIGRIGVNGTASGDSVIGHIQNNAGFVDLVRGTKMTLTAQDVTNGTTAMVTHMADIRFLHQGDVIDMWLEILQAAAAGVSLITDKTRSYFNAIRLL